MEFRDLATRELSALVTRLSEGWSESSGRELRALREALAAATAAAETALSKGPALKEQEQASDLANRLSVQASAYAKASAERVAKEAKSTIDGVRKQLQDQIRENKNLTTAADQIRAQADGLRAQLSAQSSRAAGLERDLNEAKQDLEAARTECACIMTQLETEAAERARLTVALNTAQKLQQKSRALEAADNPANRQAAPARGNAADDVEKLASMPLNHLKAKFQSIERNR